MRTTLTLDTDVASMLERVRRARRESLKTIVNEALRVGLRHMFTPRRKRPFHRTQPVDLGRCLVGNVDDVAEILAVVEGEVFR